MSWAARNSMRARRTQRRRNRRCRRTGNHFFGSPVLNKGERVVFCKRCLHRLLVETFPAPREDDCRYGCCKAGDVGIASEAVRS